MGQKSPKNGPHGLCMAPNSKHFEAKKNYLVQLCSGTLELNYKNVSLDEKSDSLNTFIPKSSKISIFVTFSIL